MNQVKCAYETRRAVCSLGHRRLLDAARVIPDSLADALPVVSNGLALCKIHHGAAVRQIPRATDEKPAPERLEIRYAEFCSA